MNYTLEQLQQRGIYTITNTITGRVYVGKTSASFERRWYAHRILLDKGRHHNKRLQADWQAHGADAFQFAIAEYINSGYETDFFSAERRHIQACATEVYNSNQIPIVVEQPVLVYRRCLFCRLAHLIDEYNAARHQAGLSTMSDRQIALASGIRYRQLQGLKLNISAPHITLDVLTKLMRFFHLTQPSQLFEYREEPKP